MPIRNSAQLALAARRLAQQPKQAHTPLVDQAETSARVANGGFRAGKRRRGNSLLKRTPRDQAHAITYNVRDEDGQLVTTIRTLTYQQNN